MGGSGASRVVRVLYRKWLVASLGEHQYCVGYGTVTVHHYHYRKKYACFVTLQKTGLLLVTNTEQKK